MKNKQYGPILRTATGILGAIFCLTSMVAVGAILSSSDGHKWLGFVSIPLVAFGLLFLDVALRGEDPPWFYNSWDVPETELKPPAQNTTDVQKPSSIK